MVTSISPFVNFKPYGALSGKKVDELQPGERVRVEEAKQDPLDFALWKRANPVNPSGIPNGAKDVPAGILSALP